MLHTPQSPTARRSSRVSHGFTLVELLVVIAIVGMLAGLITAAAWRAIIAGKNAVIKVELSQLDAACKAYKEKFGEYPPDFAGVVNDSIDPLTITASNPTGDEYYVGVRKTILRHLARAFPKYRPGVSTDGYGDLNEWDGLRADILGHQPDCAPGYVGWGIDIETLTPACALAFFLGGKPEWRVNSAGNPILPGDTSAEPFDTSLPVKSLRGFSANLLNPFDNSPSRTKPFYEFDVSSLGWSDPAGGVNGGIVSWPRVQEVTDKTHGPIVYFRAENGNYTMNGAVPNGNTGDLTNNIKSESLVVWPAADTRVSNFVAVPASIAWMNPQSIQIFASGLDLEYTAPSNVADTPFYGLLYPSGDNYGLQTFDDITNFSDGTLEASMP